MSILKRFFGFEDDEPKKNTPPVKEPEKNNNEFTMSEEALVDKKDEESDNASVSTGVIAQKEENKPITFGEQTQEPVEQNVAPENEKPVEKPAETPTPSTTEDDEYKNAMKQYYELIDILKGEKAINDERFSKENEDKRERAEKSALFVSRLSDVADVMLQAYNHARGLPNISTAQNASDKTMQRILQSRREMEGYRQKGLSITKAIADIENKMVSMKQAKERQERLDKETKIKQAKAEAYRGYYEAMANKNNEMAAFYKAKAEALEEGKSLDEALKLAKIAKEKASANKTNAEAANVGKTKTVDKETATEKNGETTYKKETTTTTTGGTSNNKDNTPPSRQNKDNTPPSRRK